MMIENKFDVWRKIFSGSGIQFLVKKYFHEKTLFYIFFIIEEILMENSSEIVVLGH